MKVIIINNIYNIILNLNIIYNLIINFFENIKFHNIFLIFIGLCMYSKAKLL